MTLPRGLGALRRYDLSVAIPMFLLLAMGPLLIASCGGGYEELAPRQMVWVFLGLLISIPASLIPYGRFLPLAPTLWVIGVGALVAVRLFAPAVNGARRWFLLGGVNVQPSEFMKLATILVLAHLLRHGQSLAEGGRAWMVMLLCGLPAALIIVQPDLGTTMLFAPLAFAVLMVGGLPARRLWTLAAVGVVVVYLGLEYGLAEYQRERILSTYRWEQLTSAQRWNTAYQLTQSLARIAAGGTAGVAVEDLPTGLEGGLPHRHNDFIFTVLAQNGGFLGASLLVGLQLWLVLAILRVAARTRDAAGRILCTGVAAAFGAQASIHFAVTMGVAPTTGMPLPLVSYGGSALLVSMTALALVQNVAMHPTRTPFRSKRHTIR